MVVFFLALLLVTFHHFGLWQQIVSKLRSIVSAVVVAMGDALVVGLSAAANLAGCLTLKPLWQSQRAQKPSRIVHPHAAAVRIFTTGPTLLSLGTSGYPCSF